MAPSLSEKAKGKQKAVDPPGNAGTSSSQASEQPATRVVTIRFSEGGLPDLDLSVGPKDTVREVQRQVSTKHIKTHFCVSSEEICIR
jgi:hypothetical protein